MGAFWPAIISKLCWLFISPEKGTREKLFSNIDRYSFSPSMEKFFSSIMWPPLCLFNVLVSSTHPYKKLFRKLFSFSCWKIFHAKLFSPSFLSFAATVCGRGKIFISPTQMQRHDINFVIKNPSPSKHKSRMKIMKWKKLHFLLKKENLTKWEEDFTTCLNERCFQRHYE